MNYLTHKDIYFHTQIRKKISLNPRFLDENFSQFLEKIVKNKIEGKCVKEGYVVPGTVVILERSMGSLNSNQFNGNIEYDLKIGAKVCNIPVNSVIKASVKKISKLGLLSELGPLMIIIPKEIHTQKDAFKDIKIGDEVELLVIGKTFDLDSKKISVYGKLNSETKKKIKIVARKGDAKTKNTVNKMANETIVPQEEGFDERTQESEAAIEQFEEDEGTELEDEIDEAELSDLDDDDDDEEMDAELINDTGSLEDADELAEEMDEPFEDDEEEDPEDDDFE